MGLADPVDAENRHLRCRKWRVAWRWFYHVRGTTAPEAFDAGLKFTAWLLASLPSDDSLVRCKDGTTIQMYRVFPLYNEEYVYARENGTEALMSVFVKHDIQTDVHLSRPNVAARGK